MNEESFKDIVDIIDQEYVPYSIKMKQICGVMGINSEYEKIDISEYDKSALLYFN
jgi:hypothetical protein